jgi:hypothetical protein
MLDSDDQIGFDQLISASLTSQRPGPTTEQLDALLLAEQLRMQQAAQQNPKPNP